MSSSHSNSSSSFLSPLSPSLSLFSFHPQPWRRQASQRVLEVQRRRAGEGRSNNGLKCGSAAWLSPNSDNSIDSRSVE